MSTGAPDEALAEEREVVGVSLDCTPVLELDRVVVQFVRAGLDKRDAVVVGVATQPADPVAERVGDAKVEYVNQEATELKRACRCWPPADC